MRAAQQEADVPVLHESREAVSGNRPPRLNVYSRNRGDSRFLAEITNSPINGQSGKQAGKATRPSVTNSPSCPVSGPFSAPAFKVYEDVITSATAETEDSEGSQRDEPETRCEWPSAKDRPFSAGSSSSSGKPWSEHPLTQLTRSGESTPSGTTAKRTFPRVQRRMERCAEEEVVDAFHDVSIEENAPSAAVVVDIEISPIGKRTADHEETESEDGGQDFLDDSSDLDSHAADLEQRVEVAFAAPRNPSIVNRRPAALLLPQIVTNAAVVDSDLETERAAEGTAGAKTRVFGAFEPAKAGANDGSSVSDSSGRSPNRRSNVFSLTGGEPIDSPFSVRSSVADSIDSPPREPAEEQSDAVSVGRHADVECSPTEPNTTMRSGVSRRRIPLLKMPSDSSLRGLEVSMKSVQKSGALHRIQELADNNGRLERENVALRNQIHELCTLLREARSLHEDHKVALAKRRHADESQAEQISAQVMEIEELRTAVTALQNLMQSERCAASELQEKYDRLTESYRHQSAVMEEQCVVIEQNGEQMRNDAERIEGLQLHSQQQEEHINVLTGEMDVLQHMVDEQRAELAAFSDAVPAASSSAVDSVADVENTAEDSPQRVPEITMTTASEQVTPDNCRLLAPALRDRSALYSPGDDSVFSMEMSTDSSIAGDARSNTYSSPESVGSGGAGNRKRNELAATVIHHGGSSVSKEKLDAMRKTNRKMKDYIVQQKERYQKKMQMSSHQFVTAIETLNEMYEKQLSQLRSLCGLEANALDEVNAVILQAAVSEQQAADGGDVMAAAPSAPSGAAGQSRTACKRPEEKSRSKKSCFMWMAADGHDSDSDEEDFDHISLASPAADPPSMKKERNEESASREAALDMSPEQVVSRGGMFRCAMPFLRGS